MIYTHDTFNEKEVVGIIRTLEDEEHPIRWFFRDDENGIKFVYYSKWMNDHETDVNKLIMSIFEKFCNKNEISIEEVYVGRISLIVQNDDRKIILPEPAYPNPENTFLYFVTDSDRPILINNKAITPNRGGAISFAGSNYAFYPPHKENFFTVIEVQYR